MLLLNRFGRVTLVVIALLIAFAIVLVAQGSAIASSLPSTLESLWPGSSTTTRPPPTENANTAPNTDADADADADAGAGAGAGAGAEDDDDIDTERKDISYDLTIPVSTGCENLVNDLQQRLIHAYSERLRGVRYANIWGYLETENKGDAAIWSAQQILLTMLGIETMEACRFMDKDCDIKKFRARLEAHKPHSAIIMAGGGNFNDYYWEDQPSRMKMISNFTDVPVRAFPQSVYMTNPERIEATKKAFTKHKDLQLAARDRPSYEWLDEAFGEVEGIEADLVPDIAFMWGNRSDFRVNTKKTHDILILARKDKEISSGDSSDIEFGEGELDLGGSVGKVTYEKIDWKFTETPGIDGEKKEKGKNQRAWAKSVTGFEHLGSARFVITDRLHGHIMSTLIGAPHVLMDSKLGKNLNFHNTWTRDCECTRIASNISEALDVARLWFEQPENQD